MITILITLITLLLFSTIVLGVLFVRTKAQLEEGIVKYYETLSSFKLKELEVKNLEDKQSLERETFKLQIEAKNATIHRNILDANNLHGNIKELNARLNQAEDVNKTLEIINNNINNTVNKVLLLKTDVREMSEDVHAVKGNTQRLDDSVNSWARQTQTYQVGLKNDVVDIKALLTPNTELPPPPAEVRIHYLEEDIFGAPDENPGFPDNIIS
jgi:DNA repair ATPase RecN